METPGANFTRPITYFENEATRLNNETYYERHKEKRLAYSNEYYAKNREAILKKLKEQRDFARAVKEALETQNA